MPESATGSRTEPPSQRRLREAWKQGRIAFSPDLAACVVVLAGAGFILLRSGDIATTTVAVVRRCIEQAVGADRSLRHILEVAGHAAWDLAVVTLPILGVIALAAFAASFLQVGPRLTARPFSLRMAELNPATGLRNILLSRRAAVELFKRVLTFTIVGAIAAAILWPARGQLARLSALEPGSTAAWSLAFIARLVFGLLLACGLLSIADMLYQRWQHRRDLMMTRDQAQRDARLEEGDPQHKLRRLQFHAQSPLAIMLQAVPSADVVIFGGERTACALRWDGADGTAPRLLAKGAGLAAASIEDAASRAGVPTLHLASLASALHEVPLGAEVPASLYEAVSDVLAWTETQSRVSGRIPNWRREPAGSA